MFGRLLSRWRPLARIVGWASRFGYGLGDQALSSLTNFALGILVARSVSTRELGIFGLAFASYLLTLTVSRLFSTDALQIRFSAVTATEWRRASRAATGTAAVLGVGLGSISIVGGLLAGGVTGLTFVALGATLPGLLVQDAWRLAFFAKGEGLKALLNDGVWVIAMVPLFSIALISGTDSSAALTLAWGLAANVAALVGVIQAGFGPDLTAAREWVVTHKDLSIPFLTESLIYNGSRHAVGWLIAAVAGLAANGAFRAAMILLGPTNILISGLSLVAVPEGARSLARSTASLRKMMVGFSTLAGAAIVAWGTILLLLPDSLGRQLLGPSWEAGRSLLIPMILWTVANGIAMGPRSGLRVLEEAKLVLRTRLLSTTVWLVSIVAGAILDGALGAAIGGAIGSGIGTLIWWTRFLEAARSERSTTSAEPTDAATLAPMVGERADEISPPDLV